MSRRSRTSAGPRRISAMIDRSTINFSLSLRGAIKYSTADGHWVPPRILMAATLRRVLLPGRVDLVLQRRPQHPHQSGLKRGLDVLPDPRMVDHRLHRISKKRAT